MKIATTLSDVWVRAGSLLPYHRMRNINGGEHVTLTSNKLTLSTVCVLLAALTVPIACSEPVTPPQPVTMQAITGRYQLEKVGGKPLPAYGPVLCFLEGCGAPYLITDGYLEIGKLGPSTWSMTLSMRDANAPFAEYTGIRSGTLTVDAYGRLALQEEGPIGGPGWEGAVAGDVLTVRIFAEYTFRRLR